MIESMEFLALQYLNDWCSDEHALVSGLHLDEARGDRLACLRRAATYYKVARNFPLRDEDRLSGALAALDAIGPSITDANVDSAVGDLAAKFQSTYGTLAISAASKFLWLRYKSPVIIFDGRAVRCLQKRDRTCDLSEYPAYRELWRRRFAERASTIRSACARLLQVKTFSLAYEMPEVQFVKLVESTWFHERVFDTYL